jgi:hypothetical protein
VDVVVTVEKDMIMKKNGNIIPIVKFAVSLYLKTKL